MSLVLQDCTPDFVGGPVYICILKLMPTIHLMLIISERSLFSMHCTLLFSSMCFEKFRMIFWSKKRRKKIFKKAANDKHKQLKDDEKIKEILKMN